MTQTAEITQQALDQFYGTSQWYRHPFKMLLTDGTMYLFEHGAGWLINAIGSCQMTRRLDVETEGFQIWELTVNEDQSCVLTCKRDSNTPNLVKQEIPYTDLPLDNIKIYVEGIGKDKVCLLPSER